jgi:serine/threonine-protein kinase HipA
MKYCPITYEAINQDEYYSSHGLRLLSRYLKNLNPLAFSAIEQRREAIARAAKMSIQGVQIKMSAQLKAKEGYFEIVDQHGHYILKPQSEYYSEMPENEAVTMSMAALIGIEIPIHGLVYSKDGSMTYFIKRFDRIGHNKKLAVEDFTQLLQLSRETKYNSSMEKVVKIIKEYCTYPIIEATKLFRLTLFNFLIGNEDMHLKNFSLITRNQKITLSPAYDLLNSTIVQQRPKEEIALPLNGKKNNLRKKDLLEYFAIEQLQLHPDIVNYIIQGIKKTLPDWKTLINHSFLSKAMQKKYLNLLDSRCERLF